ncbi:MULTISPECIES: threonine synthase [unclassified Moorena]|uniref:threonine synthase n=1 Tax=unclassified Moorena TaxID=2683338 RepID=UPI0013FF66E0|nr:MULTISPECIES: threonine synthase [unclassified Moorena]NEO15806.1 threonine synthase [Moorena sp. SIO3E8]NEQ01562.1 threonine synthase [Moorena sp. SIO3F7]
MNMYIEGAKCIRCNKEWQISEIRYQCPTCQGNLDIAYNYKALRNNYPKTSFRQNKLYSIWRYLPFLPLKKMPERPLQLGWTPLYPVPNEYGIKLFIKDEGRNPSGSLKDRATAIVLEAAQEAGITHLTTASTGNAGSSLACLSASMGIETTVFVPDKAPEAKIAQMCIFGTRVYSVIGSYDDAYDLCIRASNLLGWYNRSTGYNPLTREGKKTCAYEICEQLDWHVPDWVIVSVGDGNILSGLWKGFKDLYGIGYIDRLPKMAGVQSFASNAIALSVRSAQNKASIDIESVQASTIADSISVNTPRDGVFAVKAILESRGMIIEVTDEKILMAIKTVAQRWGIFGEPAGVACVAGLEKLWEDGTLKSGEVVVCIITGNGLKDVGSALKASLNRVRVIESQSDLTQVLRRI